MPDPASATEAPKQLTDLYSEMNRTRAVVRWRMRLAQDEKAVPEDDLKVDEAMRVADDAERAFRAALTATDERLQQATAAGVAEGIERAAKRIEEIADEDRYMSRHLMGQLAGEIRTLGRDQEGKIP